MIVVSRREVLQHELISPSAQFVIRTWRSGEMKPNIDQTTFGSITIEGTIFGHDVVIRLSGQVEKRRKKLSKAIYGTSHILSLAEAKQVYEPEAKRLIIGTGQEGNVRLSEEAADYFKRKQCQV